MFRQLPAGFGFGFARLHLHFYPSLQHANPTSILDPDPLKRIALLQEKLVVYFSSSNHGKVETGYSTVYTLCSGHFSLKYYCVSNGMSLFLTFSFLHAEPGCSTRSPEKCRMYTLERYKYIDPSKSDYVFGYPF